MANLNKPVDVCVIDEVQFIEDQDRGAAWTRALLGIQAQEVHVCGEERTEMLLRQMCHDTGEEFHVHRYQRLTPLTIQDSSIHSDLSNIREGDAIVCFSRKDIFTLKQKIESSTKYRVAVVYGGLPPHVRIQQATLFNKPNSEYDVLVATDAIGFGLNLNIRRVIFSTLSKYDGYQERLLEPAQIRQIAGRAGRYLSRFPNGEVTAFREKDRQLIQKAFEVDIPDIEAAGLRPSVEQLMEFAREFPDGYRFSELLSRFEKLTTCDDKYFMCNFDDQKEVANLIHRIPLGFIERYTIVQTPVDSESVDAMRLLYKYVSTHSNGEPVPVIASAPENAPRTVAQLKEVEEMYKILDAYSWLSYRFPQTFRFQEEAEQQKRKCRTMIEKALKSEKWSREERHSARRTTQKLDKLQRQKDEVNRKLDEINNKLRQHGVY